MRADFYPQCTELPALRPLLAAGQVVAGPLGVDDLRRAVHTPARDAGLTLEPGLEELLLTDLGALHRDGYPPGALPLLAHALRATWERRSGTTLTVEGYRAAGGIRNALAETAERVYLSLPAPGREKLRVALLALVTMAGDLPVRAKAAPADTEVLGPLIEARLVTVGRDGAELSHEALLTGWPRLVGWLNEAREELLLRQRLAQAAGDWAGDPDALWRGTRLAAAREWAADRTDLSEAQSRFLTASETAERARERDRQRGARRLRGLAAGLAVLLLLAVIGGVVALQQSADARDNARVAHAQSTALRARTELFTNGPAAMRDALDAWAGVHTQESLSALLSTQQDSTLGTLGTGAALYSVVAVSPDGRRAATGSYGGAIQLWDTATLTPAGPALHQPGGQLYSLAFSPDGRYLASAGLTEDGVAVWDVPAGTLRFRLPAAGAVTWRPDSTVAASRAENGRLLFAVGFWDPRDGHLIESVPTLTNAAQSLAISRDGRYLASSAVAGRSDIIRLTDRKRLAVLPAKTSSVTFAADDSLVALLPGGRAVAHWGMPSGRRLADLGDRGSPTLPGHIAVAPDGTVFVPGEGPANIVELRLTGGARLPLNDYPGAATAMDLSADGHLLLVAGINAPPMLFRTAVDRLNHPQLVGFVAADPTGTRLATGSHDPVVRIWDPRTSALIATLPLPGDDGPIGLAYGPDGSLAAALDSGVVQVFDPAGRVEDLHADSGLVATDPVFSPDGTLIAATVNDADPATQEAEAVKPGIPDLIVWDAHTGAVRARVEMPGTSAIGVAFSPDGSRLYGASNRFRLTTLTDTGSLQSGKVWAFRTSDYGLAASADLDGAAIGSMRLSPDGRLLAVGAANQVRLLRAADLHPDGTIAVSAATPGGLAFSPDGRTLAVTTPAENDFTRLWDVASGDLRAILSDSSHDGPAAYLPDGRTLAVGSSDGLVVLWRLDPAEVVRRLCAVVTPQARVTGQATPGLCR